MKTCTKCKKELSIDNFTKEKSKKDGLRCWCKACARQYFQENKDAISKRVKPYHKQYYEKNRITLCEKDKQYRKNNKLAVSERSKTYFQKNKDTISKKRKQYYLDNKIIMDERNRQWAQDNKIYFSELKKQYRQKNKITISKCIKKWRENNKEKSRIYDQERRARKNALPYDFTTEQWIAAKEYFNNRCAYCGCEAKLTQDHFKPLSLNGEYSISNIIPACGSCNSSKSNNSFFTWFPAYRHYSEKREAQIIEYVSMHGENLDVYQG